MGYCYYIIKQQGGLNVHSVHWTAKITSGQSGHSIMEKVDIKSGNFLTANCRIFEELVAFRRLKYSCSRHYFKTKQYLVHYILSGKV